jgi:spore maturation protein CgeB
LRVLVVGKFYTKLYTEGFAMHICESLEAMGHEALRFEPGYKTHRFSGRFGQRVDQITSLLHSTTDSMPAIRARRAKTLYRAVEGRSIDAVIVCHDFLWAEEVDGLKRITGAPIAMWFPDHLANFGRGHFMNAAYDALFFKDPYIVPLLQGRVRSPVHYLPECFNPARHRLPEGEAIDERYRCDITTAGNFHAWRVALYNQLSEYDVKLWGDPIPRWMPKGPVHEMHQGRFVMNEEKARAFLGAKIVLNNLHYGEVWGVNVRAFEAAGIGAFQMVDWKPGLDQLLQDGKEVVSFRGVGDLHEKLRYWLGRPEDRAIIAAAGKARAHREHTYAIRLSTLLETLAGHGAGHPMPDVRW